MRELLKASVPRLVETRWGTYEVRPATVYEALVVTATAENVLLGVEEDEKLFFEALRGWFPPSLLSVLVAEGYTEEDRRERRKAAIRLAVRVANQGAKRPKEKIAKEQDADPDELDWMGLVSDYQAAFGLSFEEVMQEKWLVFLKQSAKGVVRQRAKWQLDYLQAKSIQFTREKQRQQRSMDRLRKIAGEKLPERRRKPRTPEEQYAVMDDLLGPFRVGKPEQ